MNKTCDVIEDEKSIETIEENKEAKCKDDKITVAFVFDKNKHDERLLRLAMRSFCKNFKQPFNVVVVGDAPGWIGENVTIIEKNWLLASDAMSDKVVLASANCYIMKPVGVEHLSIPKVGKSGYLTCLPTLVERSVMADLIEDEHLQYDKLEKVLEVYLEKMAASSAPIEIDWKTDCVALPVVTQKPSVEKMEVFALKKWFFYNMESGVSETLVNFLEGIFREKCEYEV